MLDHVLRQAPYHVVSTFFCHLILPIIFLLQVRGQPGAGPGGVQPALLCHS